ncbi:MAG: hypothetical protein SGJ19_05140 [Planctomycetia bacterium]|nr:hypothetical protein [Planctomycetia bacterium]
MSKLSDVIAALEAQALKLERMLDTLSPELRSPLEPLLTESNRRLAELRARSANEAGAKSVQRPARRRKAAASEIDQREMERLLAAGKLSQREIGERLGVPRHRVIAAARKIGVKRERKLRFHAETGQGFICVNGRREYLGPFHAKATKKKYRQRLAELAEAPPAAPAVTSPETPADEILFVKEMLLHYWSFAEKRYQTADKQPKPHLDNLRQAVMRVEKQCGHTLVSELRVAQILEMRDAMIDERRARTYINSLMARVKQIFKWALVREVVRNKNFGEAASRICNIDALGAGESGAREAPKPKRADDIWVEATLPYLPPPVRDMVRIQRLTGCRAGNAMGMQTAEVDRTADPAYQGKWMYRPSRHKTAHLGEECEIPLGEEAQAILSPYLLRYPTGYLFRPADAIKWRQRERDEAIRAAFLAGERDAKVLAQNFGLTACNVYRILQPLRTDAGAERAPSRRVREKYDRNSYGHAITRGIREANQVRRSALEKQLGREPTEAEWKRAEIPHWSSHCLRRARATEARAQGGLEAAQSALGHKDQRTTERYAPVGNAPALRIAR